MELTILLPAPLIFTSRFQNYVKLCLLCTNCVGYLLSNSTEIYCTIIVNYEYEKVNSNSSHQVTNSIELSPSWEVGRLATAKEFIRIYDNFIEPGISLPCSQQPSTCSYPEQYNPHHRTLSLQDPFQFQSTHLRLGLSIGLSTTGFLMHSAPPPPPLPFLLPAT